MWTSSPSSRTAIFAVVLSVLLATGITTFIQADRMASHEEMVIHTFQVLSLLNGVSARLEAAKNARQAYVLTADNSRLKDFDSNAQPIPGDIGRLRVLTADNPQQQERLAALGPLVDARLNLLQQSIELQDRDPSARDQQLLFTRQGIALDRKIAPLLAAAEGEEDQLVQQRSQVAARTHRIFNAAIVLAFSLALAILAALFLLMSSEVTRRTRAEAVARENEERFRLLVSGIQDYAIVRLDLEGRITTWNRGAERVFGYRTLGILGKPLSHLFQSCDHDTPERHLKTALRDGHIQDECQQVRNDGTVFWTTADLTLLRNENGEPRGYALIIRDITERRRHREAIEQREAQLNAFFSNAPVGLAIIDKDLRFQRINAPFSKLNGLAPQENKGLHVRDVTSELATELEPLIRQVAATGTPVLNHEIKGHAPANPGVTGWWLKSFFPITKEGEMVTQIGAIVQDITPLKRAENTVRWLSGRLLQLRDDERRRIARDLHDSLGQLLSAIKMNLSYLGRDTIRLDDRGRNAVAESKELIDNCIKEVRTLSHLLHPPMLDEVGLLPAIRWFVNGFSQRSGVDVQLDLPEALRRLPVELEIAVFRVVQESLTNVHRHSESSTALVKLEVDDERVHLQVTDHGRGIPPQVLSARQENAAVGIGILGMRERMLQLGGELQIVSAGEGTTVHVTLPTKEAA